MSEVLRGVEPVMQPSPALNPGGDCFACALTAAMRSLFPERDIQLKDIWDGCKTGKAYGHDEPILNNNWAGMQNNIANLRYGLELPIEQRVDFVEKSYDPNQWSCSSWWGAAGEGEYCYRAEAWLAAGWLLLADIHFAPTGPYDGEMMAYSPDHTILIDGARNYWKQNEYGASLCHEIHIVCSVRGAYWIRVMDLQRRHGVGAWRMIRRSDWQPTGDYVADEVAALLREVPA